MSAYPLSLIIAGTWCSDLEVCIMSRNVHWFSGHSELRRKLDVCLNRIYIFLRHSEDTKQM